MNPIRDPMLFAGRHAELEQMEYYLKLSKGESKYFHLALVGPRTAGKTSFLNVIEHMANDLRCLAVKIPLNKEAVQNDILFFKEVFDGIITAGAEKGLYGGTTGTVYRAYRKVVDRLDVNALWKEYCVRAPCCALVRIPASHHFRIKRGIPGSP